MRRDIRTRRDFIKSAGLGTAAMAVSAYAKDSEPIKNARGISTQASPSQLCKADVLVVGGGPARIGAALGAARTGTHRKCYDPTEHHKLSL